jgi:trans-aconitate 2-methyltransferase
MIPPPAGLERFAQLRNDGRVVFILPTMSYTFGDDEEASRRLRRLAEVYEPETRGLLELAIDSGGLHTLRLAVDLGCGPGWTTQLLDAVLKPQRTVGLDLSDRYIAEARSNCPKLEFLRHDILQLPFPVEASDLFLCRFLLTHLPSPQTALQTWAEAAAPQAILLIHETERLESTHPALHRYYEFVDEMQRHYGQELNVGAILGASFAGTAWRVRQSRSLVLEKPARDMAQLHLPNLRTWGKNEYAAQSFDRRELDELEATLDSIASGASEAGIVHNIVRQIVAERK